MFAQTHKAMSAKVNGVLKPARVQLQILKAVLDLDVTRACLSESNPDGLTYDELFPVVRGLKNGVNPVVRGIPLEDFPGVRGVTVAKDGGPTPQEIQTWAEAAANAAIREEIPAVPFTGTVVVKVDGRTAFGRMLSKDTNKTEVAVRFGNFGRALTWATTFVSVLKKYGIESEVKVSEVAPVATPAAEAAA